MLISFFNPSDLISCGGDINQSEEGYVEGVRGGGMQRGYMEGVHGGGMWRECITVCPWLPLVAPSNHRFSG